jgi:methylated-DNA-protein-cysteine methyltransferase-like protein
MSERKPETGARGPKRRSRGKGVHDDIYRLARLIPPGRVATYGQLAAIHGDCTPRMVGYAMAGVPAGSDVPWHRVINSKGEISFPPGSEGREVQRTLLEAEGVEFDGRGKVDLRRFGWGGPGLRRD